MHGFYETTDSRHLMAITQLTKMEMAAWKRHPETFFGEVRKISKQANNWLELSMFFYETHKSSERSKLLEWMKDSSDIEHLKTLTQEELAIIYCERLGWSANADAERAANSNKVEQTNERDGFA